MTGATAAVEPRFRVGRGPLIVLGVVAAAAGAWLRREHAAATGSVRLALIVVGAAAVAYGMSGLTGYFVAVVQLLPIPLGLLLILTGAWLGRRPRDPPA